MDTDWDCLIRAQRGDGTSCRELIKRYQRNLMAFALLITGSATAADDVVQETFIRALNAKLRNTKGSVKGYLATIAYRLALKESKRVKRNVELGGLDPPDQKLSPLEEVLVDERDRIIARAIRALNVEHRDVLVLRFYGGHTLEEIAGLLNIPLGTVKSRVFYAIKSCREMLGEKGVLE